MTDNDLQELHERVDLLRSEVNRIIDDLRSGVRTPMRNEIQVMAAEAITTQLKPILPDLLRDIADLIEADE